MYDKHKVTIDLEELQEMQVRIRQLEEDNKESAKAIYQDALLLMLWNTGEADRVRAISILHRYGIEVKFSNASLLYSLDPGIPGFSKGHIDIQRTK